MAAAARLAATPAAAFAVALALLLLAAAAPPAHAQRDVFQASRRSASDHNPNERFRACGRNLSNMLHEVCNGYYNALFTKKSAKDAEAEYWWNEPSSAEERPLPYPLKALAKSSSFLNGQGSRRKRGLSDNCCRKSCTYSELRSYCG